jgi:hypothetical protein
MTLSNCCHMHNTQRSNAATTLLLLLPLSTCLLVFSARILSTIVRLCTLWCDLSVCADTTCKRAAALAAAAIALCTVLCIATNVVELNAIRAVQVCAYVCVLTCVCLWTYSNTSERRCHTYHMQY